MYIVHRLFFFTLKVFHYDKKRENSPNEAKKNHNLSSIYKCFNHNCSLTTVFFKPMSDLLRIIYYVFKFYFRI